MVRFESLLLLGLSSVVGLAFLACGSASPRTGFDPSAPDSGTSAPDSGTSGFSNEGGVDAGDPDGCSDQARLVYVVSLEGDLYSFAPAEKKFTKVGALNCFSGFERLTPQSMAVDRNAVAWVNMEGSSPTMTTIFKVNTTTATCTPTRLTGNLGGMGFSTNPGTKDQETLYVVGQPTMGGQTGLLMADVNSETFVHGPDFNARAFELTGTGDGRLFAFTTETDPLGVAQVDKSTAKLSNNFALTTVEKPSGSNYAFSFWGGDFYFYTATSDSPSNTTNVTRYRPSDGTVDTAYMKSIGFHIVGAGVSTCAPTTPPR